LWNQFIRGETLNAEEELVSFDVVSFYTKFPVDLAIKVGRKDFFTKSITACGRYY
jgi:hypothetical protein